MAALTIMSLASIIFWLKTSHIWILIFSQIKTRSWNKFYFHFVRSVSLNIAISFTPKPPWFFGMQILFHLTHEMFSLPSSHTHKNFLWNLLKILIGMSNWAQTRWANPTHQGFESGRAKKNKSFIIMLKTQPISLNPWVRWIRAWLAHLTHITH